MRLLFLMFLLQVPVITLAQSITTGELDSRFEDISTQESVSRYDLTEFLVLATCNQCALPDASQKERYTDERWDEQRTTPGVYVSDVFAGEERYQGREYSYCMGEVVDAGRMNGYPTSTSPLCPGRFCGSNTLVFGEFTQALLNVLQEGAYAKYTLDRKAVTSRMADQPENFTLQDATLVKNARNACDSGSTCSLKNDKELLMYTRYCRYHLQECGIQTTRTLGEGDYPLVEVNVLVDQGVFSWEDVMDFGRYDLVNGSFFSKTLQRIVSEKGCEWKLDYDNDGLINTVDDCPNTYDPDQRDQDKDGIGDVCDDDIDGDTIKNEIGVVDDSGYINFPLLEISDDNCVFFPNTDQVDTNENGRGDACEEFSGSRAFSIAAEPLTGTAPLAVTFDPIYSGNVVALDRNFGDRSYGETVGSVDHVYDTPGTYVVKAVATFDDDTLSVGKSTIRVIKPDDTASPISTDLIVDPILGEVGAEINGTLEVRGIDGDMIRQVVWDWSEGKTRNKSGANSLTDSFSYTAPGTYRVTTTLFVEGDYFVNEQTVEIVQDDTCSSNSGSCDLDGDGVVDQCDDDIDGDGAKNLLGILSGENDECDFSEDIINDDRLKEQDDLIKKGDDLDNCFVDENPSQADSDSNGVGDACDGGSNGGENGGETGANGGDTSGENGGETGANGGDNSGENGGETGANGGDNSGENGGETGANGGDNSGENGGETGTNGGDNSGENGGETGTNGGDNSGENGGTNNGGAIGGENGDAGSDRDGDGIPDDSDACPGVPESNNGYQGKDGCPEPPQVSMPDEPRDPYISAGKCLQCPCPQSNYDAELMPGDRVKAVLVDTSGEIIYSHSSPVLIREFE